MALEIIREQSDQARHEAVTGRRRARLTVSLASTESEMHEAQALRYRVFAGELGARLHSSVAARDVDSFDAFLQASDRARRGERPVGCLHAGARS